MLGYSLKPFGSREPLGEILFSLIDQRPVVVLEYPPALERASSQVPRILERPGIATFCQFELVSTMPEIADSPYAHARFYRSRSRVRDR